MTQIKHHIGKLFRINPLKVTTDKLAAYKNALQSVFTDIDYVYLQIVKKRVKMRLVTVKKCFVKGTEDDFKGWQGIDSRGINLEILIRGAYPGNPLIKINLH